MRGDARDRRHTDRPPGPAASYAPSIMAMTVSVCPATLVNAPVERVWSLLMDPHQIGAWSDALLEAAVPDGSVRVGQRLHFSATGLGRRWPVIMVVTGL